MLLHDSVCNALLFCSGCNCCKSSYCFQHWGSFAFGTILRNLKNNSVPFRKVSFSSQTHSCLFDCTVNLSSILSSVQFHFKMSVISWLDDSTGRFLNRSGTRKQMSSAATGNFVKLPGEKKKKVPEWIHDFKTLLQQKKSDLDLMTEFSGSGDCETFFFFFFFSFRMRGGSSSRKLSSGPESAAAPLWHASGLTTSHLPVKVLR